MTKLSSYRVAISVILVLSVAILFFLFWLIYFRDPLSIKNFPELRILPATNALFNFLSAISVIFGFLAIRKNNRKLHIKFMLSALSFSFLFLISYLIYHTFHGDTPYQGEGWIRTLYFFILISHVLLSVLVLPMILTTVFFAVTGNFAIHPKIAKITLPIWLYVSITGVLVYLLLYQL